MNHSVGFIYAHPDDETFLSACLIRQLADAGHEPILLLATKGDAGKKNGDVAHLSKDELATMRVQEMEKAAAILGISLIEHLSYPDGELTTMDTEPFVEKVVTFINKHQPKIIFTFPEDGGNGHPDHRRISAITTKAVLSGRCASVQKLYYIASNTLRVNGHGIAYSVDTEKQWAVKAEALKAHHSQIFAIHRYFGDLQNFPVDKKYESFVLAWERGVYWPKKAENTIFDDLIQYFFSEGET